VGRIASLPLAKSIQSEILWSLVSLGTRRRKGLWAFAHRNGTSEKVIQNMMSNLGKNGLRMKLDSLYRMTSMSYSHYHPVGSSGAYFQARRKPLRFDNQGMVACGRKGTGQTLIDSLAIVADEGSLPMDWCTPNNLAPVGIANALVSQAYPEYGDSPTQIAHHIVGNTSVQGSARTR